MNNTNTQKAKISIRTVKKTSNILKVENLTFSYNQREDRILFIINHSNANQRIDFFVTRRMMLQLLEAFDNILINYCDNGKVFKDLYNNQEELVSSKILSKDEKKEDKKEQNIHWEKSVNTKDLDFTKTKDPIILDSLSYSVSSSKNITLKFISSNKTYAISVMDFTMFQKTLSSMMRVIPFVSWGMSPHILD